MKIRLRKNRSTEDEILGRARKHDTGDDISSRGIKARYLESKQGCGLPKPSKNKRILGGKNQRGEKRKAKRILIVGNENVSTAKMMR
jgi:hypothetical protein